MVTNQRRMIIFDFDGTLADTETVILQSIQALQISELSTLTIEDYQQLKQLGLREGIKQVGLPVYKLPGIVLRAQQQMQKMVHDVVLYPGIEALIQTLHDEGFTLGILTSNSHENVTKLLSLHNLDSYFEFIFSEKNLFGKARSLKKLLDKEQLRKDQVVYIGDEVRDYEACREVGVQMIGVAWGFNSKETLRKHGLLTVAKQPTDISDLINKIEQ